MSSTVDPGAQVRVPCSPSRGAFPDEYLITIETADGPLAGFINCDEVVEDGGTAYVRGTVRGVAGDKIVVDLPGSFFTTTGIAYFPRRILENTL